MKFWGIFLLLPVLVIAQPEFFGYFESEADVMQLGSESYNFGYNKFRLDVEARPNDHILIGVNISAQQYWGQTTWNLLDFIPDFGYLPEHEINIALPDTMLLDNIYMKLSFPLFDFTFGRQQISPGVGYAWNPTDIFNSKTLLDPSYEQTGIEALRLDIPLGNRSSFIAILQPEAELNRSTQQYVFKGGLGSFDFSLTGSFQERVDYTVPILGDLDIKERKMVGGSLVGELLGWGLWGEFSTNDLEMQSPFAVFDYNSLSPLTPLPDQTFTEYVLGTDYTFDNSLYFLGEYFHNGFGVMKREDLAPIDYFAALGGASHSLMQDYIFLYTMHPTFDFVSMSTLVFANLNDNSGTFAPQLDWNAFEDTNISLQGSLFWGDDDTEFGLQDWGLRLRVRSDF
ncbi:MAG: hypothetical protein HQ556_06345 [Candidatus Marinimicrobia bacterium]|nr:hypothetical protein [Candidatus Neomarinimicrobiota bacterium]